MLRKTDDKRSKNLRCINYILCNLNLLIISYPFVNVIVLSVNGKYSFFFF